MFKRILVALDGSELGELSLPYAEELAGAFNSEVTVVLVCDKPGCRYQNEHQAYLEKMARLMGEHIKGRGGKAKVKRLLLKGHAAEEIIDYATQNDIDLIVIATHGRSGVMSWVMGSVAYEVLHGVNVPVLLVRTNSPLIRAGKREMRNRILVPLDGSEAGEAVLPYVRELTERLKIKVDFLQVIEPGQHVHTVGGLTYVPFPEQEVENLKAQAKEYLGGISSRFEGTGITVRVELRSGDPATEIIKFADEAKSRLIAMSPHEHTGVLRFAFGGMVQKILHGGKTSILLVRPAERKA